jgi:hypothetical protein
MSAIEILSLSFTIGSILISAATFILGFYLVERNRGAPSSQIQPFRLLALSLTVPLFLLVPISIALVSVELGTSLFVFTLLSAVCFFVPVFVILAILSLNWS